MTSSRRRALWMLAGVVALAGAAVPFLIEDGPRYLPRDTSTFSALLPAPPAADSAETRRELGELLELQSRRSARDVEAAQADKNKDVSRFYAALGFDPRQAPRLPKLRSLTDGVESDVARYVRAPKERFRRLRPYEIESRLDPCIGDVQGDLSYPNAAKRC